MSIQQEIAQTFSAVTHSRSLFSASGRSVSVGTSLGSAAQGTLAAGRRAEGMSGVLIDRHRDFVADEHASLSHAARTDAALVSQVNAAAEVNRVGAQKLDEIVARTRAVGQMADGALTVPEQKRVLAELHSQLTAAQRVVTSGKEEAGRIANRVHALEYPRKHVQPAGYDPDSPARPPVPSSPDRDGKEDDRRKWSGVRTDTNGSPPKIEVSSEPSLTNRIGQFGNSTPTPATRPGHPAVTAVDFRSTPPQKFPTPQIVEPSENCVRNQISSTVGPNLVKDGFNGAVNGAIVGAITGVELTPELEGVGGIPGGVLGFVGGFMKGILSSVPKTVVKSELHCRVDGFWGS